MQLVEKLSNILGDSKEEVVMTPLQEKNSSTKDVDKGTGELEDMKESLVKIRRKGLFNFESQFKGYIGWFKLDSGVNNNKKSTIYS